MSIPIISPIEITVSAIPGAVPAHDDSIIDAEFTVHDEHETLPGERRLGNTATTRGVQDIAHENMTRSADGWRAKIAAARQRLKGDDVGSGGKSED